MSDTPDAVPAAGLPPRRAFASRSSLVLGYAVVAAVCALAIGLEFRQIDNHVETLARERGNALFRLVELTRDWNARHGGVYVPVTELTQPNPYLKHKRRDVETTDGRQLTMVNPAFMTRQIAEIAEQAEGIRLHITSRKPIRPANMPDAWEDGALQAFERGESEVLALLQTGDGAVHRYMAPLVVKQPCLACHAEQGYKLGDIRGGISVTMPAAGSLAVRDMQRTRILLSVALAGAVVAALWHLFVTRSRRHFQHLAELNAGQERLIDERTQELSAANAQLRGEVVERERREVQISESEARFRSLIESSQDAILIVQATEFAVSFVNDEGVRLLDLAATRIIGRPLLDFVDTRDRDMVGERLMAQARGEHVLPSLRVRICQPDGSRQRVCDVHVAHIDMAGPVQWALSLKDVTDRLGQERALQIAAAVMASAAEGIVVTNDRHRIIEINPAFSSITGYPPQQVLGQELSILGSGRHDGEFFRSLWQTLDAEGRWEGEVWNRRPDGEAYIVWMAITAIHGEGAESGGRHVATFIDITQRKEVEELLRHRAQSDPLTDLPNRHLFFDRLQVALAQSRRYSEEFALLYIDLDYFKKVNDSFGHPAGDQLLIEAAHRLTGAVRDSDTVARLGGDEFAVILTKVCGPLEVEEIAQRIVAAMAAPFALTTGEVTISASVGAAIYPQHGCDVEQLKSSADAALYAVKEAGRNGYRIYQPYCR